MLAAQIAQFPQHAMRPAPTNPDAHPLGGGADRPADVLASETIRAMHLSRMRPAPEFARGQLAAWIGAERTANAENNSPGRRHDGITELFARDQHLKPPLALGTTPAPPPSRWPSGSTELEALPTTCRHANWQTALPRRCSACLILRPAIVLYVRDPTSSDTGKQWLARELPKNRRRTEVSVSLQWQRWCRRQAQ